MIDQEQLERLEELFAQNQEAANELIVLFPKLETMMGDIREETKEHFNDIDRRITRIEKFIDRSLDVQYALRSDYV